MIPMLTVVIGGLVLAVIYLCARLSHIQTRRRIVSVPTTGQEPKSGGCLVLSVAILMVVIVLVIVLSIAR
jgi:hypothetical protein